MDFQESIEFTRSIFDFYSSAKFHSLHHEFDEEKHVGAEGSRRQARHGVLNNIGSRVLTSFAKTTRLARGVKKCTP